MGDGAAPGATKGRCRLRSVGIAPFIRGSAACKLLGCSSGAAQRDFTGRDALDPPAAYGVAFRDLQRLVAVDCEDCDAAAGRRNDPGQSRIGEIGVGGSAGSVLRRPPRAVEEGSSEGGG